MAARPRNQSPADEPATRQLGLGFSFVPAGEARPALAVAETHDPARPSAVAAEVAEVMVEVMVEVMAEVMVNGDGAAGAADRLGVGGIGDGAAVVDVVGRSLDGAESPIHIAEADVAAALSMMPTPAPRIASVPPPPLVADVAAAARTMQPAPVPEIARAPRVFAVGELVRAARLTLESRFTEVRVEGEVSGFKRSGPGHIYFTLKDDHAALDCVMYAREAARLRFRIDDGMAVRVRGRLTIYEGRGRFQMSVAEIEPTGAGALAIAFEQLKQKLEAAGLFDPARKRRLPFLPRRLGVVTSPQGAVIRDIIHVAHRRFPIPILLAPTPVQGPGAAASIVAALERLAAAPEVDVIILARGGGSIEDLWSFNEEDVARAIAACPVPVISGVGHDTDFTIADFVADVRAPTPSAAAELAVPVLTELRAEVVLLGQRAGRAVSGRLRHARLFIERGRARLGDPRRLCDERRQLVDDLAARAHRALLRRVGRARSGLAGVEVALSRAHPHRRIASQRALFIALRGALDVAARADLSRRRRDLDQLRHKLDALSPRRVLDRGYSLAFNAEGHVLTDAAQAQTGDRISVALRAGTLTAEVVAADEKAGDA